MHREKLGRARSGEFAARTSMSGRCARWSYGRQPTETLPKCFSHGALYQPNPVTAVKTVATRKRAVQLFILCAPIMRYKTPLQSQRHASQSLHATRSRIFKVQLTKASAVDSAGELETQECKCFRSRLRPNTEQSEPNASRGASKVANSES
jgi:hypothetical protein